MYKTFASNIYGDDSKGLNYLTHQEDKIENRRWEAPLFHLTCNKIRSQPLCTPGELSKGIISKTSGKIKANHLRSNLFSTEFSTKISQKEASRCLSPK